MKKKTDLSRFSKKKTTVPIYGQKKGKQNNLSNDTLSLDFYDAIGKN